jgi:hypothetical protein
MGPRMRDGDPHWYRDAILYELHVRAFADSDGDGVGDHPDTAGGEVTDPRERTPQGYGAGRSADYGCYPWLPPPSFPPGWVPGGATGTSRRTGPDTTRPRRTRDGARQRWYAYWRSVRFARRMGFAPPPASDPNDLPAGS